jgi:hypothetical protein
VSGTDARNGKWSGSMAGWVQPFLGTLLAAALATSTAAAAQDIPVDDKLPLGAYAAYAVSEDAGSLDPERPENKQLRDKGIGFPVTVVQLFERHALVGSGAARVLVPVPLGWRGFDDGRRTRLFHPNGEIGIVVSAYSLDKAGGWDNAREEFWQQVRQHTLKRRREAPRYSATLLRLPGGQFGVREINVPDTNGPFSSIIVFMRHPLDPALAVRVNLFTPVDEFDRYLGLAGLVVRDIRVPKR